jgi:hypothetical protein
MEATSHDAESGEFLKKLQQIEERLARIERHLDLAAAPVTGGQAVDTAASDEEAEEKLELQLGQNWFAKVGIALLALGVVFLLTFPYHGLPPALPSLVGYLLVGGIVALSRYWRRSYEQVSRYLLGGALLLLYFTTLRLSRFTVDPAITSTTIQVALLLLVVGVNLVVAARRESQYLAGIHLALGYFTALLAGEAYFTFTILTVLCVLAVYFRIRFNWSGIPLIGISLTLLTHFLWATNNPVFGNSFQLVYTPEGNLLFLLLYAIIFGVGGLLVREWEEVAFEIFNALLNGLGFYSLLLLFTLTTFRAHAVDWHLAASAVFLALSVAYWIRRQSKYITFIYAMLGYGALSIGIIVQFRMPDFFVWLCWQSIIVLSTAVWFRSRFIVVSNIVIYGLVLVAYLFTAGTVSVVSIGFGIVALLSARILNWQRDRLELRTEMMRNVYLASALFIIPYTLYRSLPSGYVSLSWLAVALGYYLISRLLKSRKYRWMALLTTALTILYVFFIDLVGIDPTLRIISFLVLGSALLVISMVYSRRTQRQEEPPSEVNNGKAGRRGDMRNDDIQVH